MLNYIYIDNNHNRQQTAVDLLHLLSRTKIIDGKIWTFHYSISFSYVSCSLYDRCCIILYLYRIKLRKMFIHSLTSKSLFLGEVHFVSCPCFTEFFVEVPLFNFCFEPFDYFKKYRKRRL